MLLLSLGQFASAQAPKVKIPPASVVYEDGVKTELVGVIDVDLQREVITVSLFSDICNQIFSRGGISCMAAADLVERFEVPLVMVRTSCGSTIYEGAENNLTVDGNLTQITVADHSTRICKDIRSAKVETAINVVYGWNAGQKTYRLLSNSHLSKN